VTIHPWNRPLWDRLTRDRERLPHALLLHGMAGVGKYQLALSLAEWLLCEQPHAGGACGRCRSCNWLAQGGHPDLHLVQPRAEDDGSDKPKRGRRPISVDDVREATDMLALSSHQGGWRVVLIRPAEAMNTAAANALLKTLEEPPPRVMLILISHQPRRLLPTVRSRCQQLAVPRPERGVALAWLAEQSLTDAEGLLLEAGGAPLLALEQSDAQRQAHRTRLLAALARPEGQDWCELAQDMQHVLAEAWGWLLRWVCDLIACRAGAPARFFPDHAAQLQARALAADPASMWALYYTLLDAGRRLQHPLNAQLLLESWLLRYASLENGHE
jgi:DNA polymerase-3 subunit delta'